MAIKQGNNTVFVTNFRFEYNFFAIFLYVCTYIIIFALRNTINRIVTMALKLKIGSPVAGEDFFGRNAELRKAETLIEDNNLMLAAPRRVGKTS